MEYEEVLFFVLGVRHYGALEEDFVARISPCRAFYKTPTTKHGLVKLTSTFRAFFLFSKLLTHMHPKAFTFSFLHE